MSQNNTSKGNITVYGLGGAGCNIASMFEQLRKNNDAGMATINPVYIDTSRSNLKPGMDSNSFYKFTDLDTGGEIDGSGGLRKTNAALIHQQIPHLLEKHRPGYASIVISSASGGSGSVISPMLVREMVQRGTKMIIVVAVGDDTTNTRIQNTLNTIASFEAISQDTGVTLAMAYFENTSDKSRTDVDSEVFELVGKLASLFSRENAELDTMDLVNFLNIHESTSYPAHLVRLETFTGDLSEDIVGDGIATVASLQRDRENNPIKMRVEHLCTGFIPPNVDVMISNNVPLHFTTRAYAFNDLATRLRAELEEFKTKREARITTTTVTRGVKVAPGLGIVL